MGKIFYLLFLQLYSLTTRLLVPFNPKAKKWVIGRKNIFQHIDVTLRDDPAKKIWMHCASLGEFEQGRPLLENFRKHYSNYKIVLSFFSSSGYEVRKDYEGADYIFYLPFDSKKNAAKWFALIQPACIFFIKYEFWNFYLQEAKKRKVPLFLISGIFRKTQPFFSWYGKFYREMLGCFTHLFLQDEASARLLTSIGIKNFSICGDTRFDRVINMFKNHRTITGINAFCDNKKTIVCGSTWLEDDEELSHFVNKNADMRFIIAPHDVGIDRIKTCQALYKNAFLYSEFITNYFIPDGKNTLIIDNIGILKNLYAYATISFVGGGFGGDGVHNVLEPAVYGRPVVFGPVYEKYAEAKGLVAAGGGFSIMDAVELETVFLELLQDKDEYQSVCEKAGAFVQNNAGATQEILHYINENRLLTS